MKTTAEASLRQPDPCAAEGLLQTPGQNFPAVSTIPRLAQIAARAAARLMHPELRVGQTSTSVRMRLWHLARIQSHPDSWRAVARYAAVRGRVHEFEVDVFDASGLIAGVEHARAVVAGRRLEALAQRRAGKPAMLLQA